MSVLSVYQKKIAEQGFTPDQHQQLAIEALQRIAEEIVRPQAKPGWKGLFKSKPAPIKGLYLWGGVGRGKTWMMDIFFQELQTTQKKRFHFHRFMQLVHSRLTEIKGVKDPLKHVAKAMAEDWRVLCLDEFNVVDIGDAVILAGLLKALVEENIVLVTTSNVEPDNLYRDGIQRASFLPAIDLLNKFTHVMHLGGDKDYRQQILGEAQVYHTPLGAQTDEVLLKEFERLAPDTVQQDGELLINNRSMPYRYASDGMTWFDFEALCGPPRSQMDYIELARCHHTVFLSDIPIMGGARDDRTRRFIFLIDEFYDRHVKLVLSAEALPEKLYIGERLAFEFQRTLSRLTEMQTPAFWSKPHLG